KPMRAVRAKSSKALATDPDCEMSVSRPDNAGTAPYVAFKPDEERMTPKLPGPSSGSFATCAALAISRRQRAYVTGGEVGAPEMTSAARARPRHSLNSPGIAAGGAHSTARSTSLPIALSDANAGRPSTLA